MDLLTAVHDDKIRLFTLTDLKSKGGNPIPFASYVVTSDDASILGILPDDGAVIPVQGDGKGVLFQGKGIGQCTAELVITTADGQTITKVISHTTLVGDAGEALVNMGSEVDDPNPAA